MTYGRNLVRFRAVSGLGLGFVVLKLKQISGFVEFLQFGLPGLEQRGQFGGRALVASRQTDPLGQTFIQIGQMLRLQFGMPGIAAQRMHCVFQLGLGCIENFQNFLEFWFDMRLIL